MTIKLYVANLGKYNEGFLVGDWFDLPLDMDEMKEKIGINDEYEEWAIHDYEAPFRISEYQNIEKLNEIAEQMEDFDETEEKIFAEFLGMGYDFDDALDEMENGNYRTYQDCFDMGDVAYAVVEEDGTLNKIPSDLKSYFDYNAYGRDLEINGTFHYLGEGVYLEIFN